MFGRHVRPYWSVSWDESGTTLLLGAIRCLPDMVKSPLYAKPWTHRVWLFKATPSRQDVFLLVFSWRVLWQHTSWLSMSIPFEAESLEGHRPSKHEYDKSVPIKREECVLCWPLIGPHRPIGPHWPSSALIDPHRPSSALIGPHRPHQSKNL